MENLGEGFCPDSFWNETVTWNTTHPRVTQCFQETVLVGIPCIFLWLLTPFWIRFISKGSRAQYPPPKGKLTTLVTKITALLILAAGLIFQLVQRLENDSIFPSEVVGPSCLLFTYALVLLVIVMERRKGIHTSPLQFYFWLIHFVVNIPRFVKDVQELVNEDFQATTLVSALTTLPILLIKVMVHSFSDVYTDDPSQPPELTTSHISFLLFAWMDGIIWKG